MAQRRKGRAWPQAGGEADQLAQAGGEGRAGRHLEALRWVDALMAAVGLRKKKQDVRKDRGDGGFAFPEGTMTILPLKADFPFRERRKASQWKEGAAPGREGGAQTLA